MSSKGRSSTSPESRQTKRRPPQPHEGTPERTTVHALQRSGGNRAVEHLLDGGDVPGDATPALQGGQPLEPSLRMDMESRFDADFGGVRVHDDQSAHASAETAGANAYTVGEHIVFEASRYQPATSTGRRLLAHELAHVVQQSRGGTPPVLDGTAPHEQDADRAASAVADGAQQVSVGAATGVGMARDEGKLSANPRLETFYKPAFFGNRTFDQQGIPGGPSGVWPYDDHLRALWLDVASSDPAAYMSEEFQDFADTVKEYQMAVMGLKWSDRGAHGVVDAATAASLIAKPIAAKKTPALAPGKLFDDEYKLADGKGATSFDPGTRIVTLSPDDKTRLARAHGYYFFFSLGIRTLIVPPEARPAIGTLNDVLVPVTASELNWLEGCRDPDAYLADLVKRKLGRAATSYSRSSQADHDYAIDKAQMPGTDRGMLERTRRRSFGIAQESTIEGAAEQGKVLPSRDMSGLDMDPQHFFEEMTAADRAAWYLKRLGPYQDQLYESAINNNIPVQLLATIILNELSDIGALDVLQSGQPFAPSGSVGIAQIQVSTAIKDRLFEISDKDAQRAFDRWHAGKIMLGSRTDPEQKAFGRKVRTSELLQTPQFAIEATAKEIAVLLTRMGQNLDKPWQKLAGFTASGPSGQSSQAYLPKIADEREADRSLSRLVVGAYNSPGLITSTEADLEAAFPNGYHHGENSQVIAAEIYDAKLFRVQ